MRSDNGGKGRDEEEPTPLLVGPSRLVVLGGLGRTSRGAQARRPSTRAAAIAL